MSIPILSIVCLYYLFINRINLYQGSTTDEIIKVTSRREMFDTLPCLGFLLPLGELLMSAEPLLSVNSKTNFMSNLIELICTSII